MFAVITGLCLSCLLLSLSAVGPDSREDDHRVQISHRSCQHRPVSPQRVPAGIRQLRQVRPRRAAFHWVRRFFCWMWTASLFVSVSSAGPSSCGIWRSLRWSARWRETRLLSGECSRYSVQQVGQHVAGIWPLNSVPSPCGFRCVFFSPDGGCLYSGSTDSLRVFGWEPDRCFDVVSVGWGKVSDLAVCNQQLVCSSAYRRQTFLLTLKTSWKLKPPCSSARQIGVSHQLSSVSSYVVDLKRVKKSGGSVIQGIIQDNQPLTEPKDPKGAALRRNYERPTTTCSSQRYDRSACRCFTAEQHLCSLQTGYRSPDPAERPQRHRIILTHSPNMFLPIFLHFIESYLFKYQKKY